MTNKLDELLEGVVLKALEEGKEGTLLKWYQEQDSDMDWIEFVAKHFPIAQETAQAITALISIEVAKAKIAALQDYLDNGEWINTEHMGYAGQKAVLEKRIATLTAEVESNE